MKHLAPDSPAGTLFGLARADHPATSHEAAAAIGPVMTWRNRKGKRAVPCPVGARYGRLVVVEEWVRYPGRRGGWGAMCECECGTRRVVCVHHLVRGTTQSCGCLKLQRARENGSKRTTHRLRHTRVYKSWSSMRERCLNQDHKSYRAYGGRGITICDRWLESVVSFRIDMGDPPRGMSLDRIDVNGNYEPANCRWATGTEQQRNKRNNRLLTIFGETKCVSAWAVDARCAVPWTGFWKRLEAGWDAERALTQIARPDCRRGVLAGRGQP